MTASIAAFLFCAGESTPDATSTGSALDEVILEKAQRSAYYRAAALQAEKDGYTEIATYLKEIAEEEKNHLSKLIVFRAAVKKDTKKNLVSLLKMEKLAAKSVYPMLIAAAKQQGNDSLALLITQIQADEQRHSLGIKGILEKEKW